MESFERKKKYLRVKSQPEMGSDRMFVYIRIKPRTEEESKIQPVE